LGRGESTEMADGRMTTDAPAGAQRPPPKKLARLRKRQEFVRASKTGARFSARLFTIQAADQGAPREVEHAASDAEPRFGFTVTRKVAGAVGRNRIRRRLKEALRVSGGLGARYGRDYVFVARRGALTAPFVEIVTQMVEGFARLDERPAANSRRKQKDRPAAS
jgi:ribonuclease P protein component